MNNCIDRLGDAVSSLELAGCGYSFASGRAAIATVLELVETGAHVIVGANVNSDAYKTFESVKRRTSGLSFSYLQDFGLNTLKAVLQENTKLIWVESIIRPFFSMPDLELVAKFAKAHDIISVCDNTLASPCLLKPIHSGFDIVLYDVKGYLSGTTEIEGGCVIVADDREFIREKLDFLRSTLGTGLIVTEQEKVCQGIETIKNRIDQHCISAKSIAEYLVSCDKVEDVSYLGFSHHPYYSHAAQKLRNPGGAFSVMLSESVQYAEGFAEKLNLFSTSNIVGGTKSAIWHPASAAYDSVPAEIKKHLGADDGCFQVSIGLENVEDIVKDLDQALTQTV